MTRISSKVYSNKLLQIGTAYLGTVLIAYNFRDISKKVIYLPMQQLERKYKIIQNKGRVLAATCKISMIYTTYK